MTYIIKFIPEAEETFKDLVIQLRERWVDRFVGKFENRVLKCLETISQTPDIYLIVDENTGIRKCILHRNCSVLYHVSDNTVSVVCFWDNRQYPIFISPNRIK